jgi:hypothetical protein
MSSMSANWLVALFLDAMKHRTPPACARTPVVCNRYFCVQTDRITGAVDALKISSRAAKHRSLLVYSATIEAHAGVRVAGSLMLTVEMTIVRIQMLPMVCYS